MILLFAQAATLLLLLSSLLSFIPEQQTFFVNAQRQLQNFLLPGHNLEGFRISESQPVDSIVYQLKAIDRANDKRIFSYHMTGDTFKVDEQTGEIRLIKPLDRERQAQVVVVVSVFDINDSKNDLPVESKRRTIFVEDVDDSWPIFTPNRHSILHSRTRFGHNFGKYVYHVNLSELAPISSVVLSELQVTDADEGLNAELQLECRQNQSTNSACDAFSIELQRHFNRLENSGRYSITIRTRQELDYESVETYKLTLVARGKRASPLKGVPLETEAVVLIDLINVQDESPRFEGKPYYILMRESFKVGERLLTISAQDGDSEPKREISMIIAPSLFSEYFQISKDPMSSKVWFLETNTTIDRENPLISGGDNRLTISVLAAELNEAGSPIASEDELFTAIKEPTYSKGTISKENITIIVLDLPDSKPLFYQASTGKPINNNVLVINISESIMSGSALPNLDLAIVDLDQGINSKFNLTLLDSKIGPPASEAFALDDKVFYGRSTIVLKLLNSSLIDYEDPNLRLYKFYLVATKDIDQQLSQILELQIHILDANDNSPKFAQDQYELNVPENSLPGTVIATISAQDRDSGSFGRVDYMLRGQGASKFKLISNEGKIMINDCGHLHCLDYELQPSFSLIYEARDSGGRTENVSVIISVVDSNDNSPNFTEQIYRRELISDNLSQNQNYISPQLIVRAKDNDGPSQGNVTYKLKSSNLTGLDVDPVSGLVYLAQPMDLLETIPKTDDGRLRDNKEIVFEAEVLAEDNGSPQQRNSTAKIILTVKDNRDGAPQFRQDSYQAFVKESQPIRKPFVQIQALDPDDKDNQLRYSLAYDLNDLIFIDSITGELSFKTQVDYDDFKGIPYNVAIQATDNTKPQPLKGSTIVNIFIQDVNNKAPKFLENEYKATIVEGRTKQGDAILLVKASDPDTYAQLNYSIVENRLVVTDKNGEQLLFEDLVNNSTATTGYLSHISKLERQRLVENLKKLFKINSKTGLIELAAEPQYSFATAVKILVKVSDLNQEVLINNNMPQEDFVECQFFLQTQLVRTPVFAQPWTANRREYNICIVEELSVGSVVFSLIAIDPSTRKNVELFEKNIESDPNDLFAVTKSGLVLINKRIDYEELPTKRLSIQVRAIIDDLLYSVANLNFDLVDLNDNSPEFEQQNYSITISEFTSYPQEILTVSAHDKDSKEFGQIYYSISGYSSHLYQIDPKRGAISVKKGAKLDRETDPENFFFVTASDCNKAATATADQSIGGRMMINGQISNNSCGGAKALVTISLLDENDNDPVFTNVNQRGEFEALISETVSVGTVIAQATAKDIDEGPNGRLSYEIVRQADNDLISRLLDIDREGCIKVTGSLSGLGRLNAYRIPIITFDHGNLSRQAHANLMLTINDVVSNDGVPKFLKPKPDEVVNLNENIGPSTFVYQVQAIDTDQESNGKIMYKFFKPSDTFEIDPFTGIIKTQHWSNFQLDRELIPNYTLIIVAQDLGTPPKQAFQALPINVLDINDNEPYFERNIEDPPVVIHVREEIPKNSLVGTIQAIDRDIGQNALIGYEIIDGNQNNIFKLKYDDTADDDSNNNRNQTRVEISGNNPCKIYSTERLDRETRESYTLTIKASSISKLQTPFIRQFKDLLTTARDSSFSVDYYNASDFTKIRVIIKLLDIDDNLPVFVSQNPKSVVDFNAEVYSELMQLKAVDLDSSNPEIHYSILSTTYYNDPRSRGLNSHGWPSSISSGNSKTNHGNGHNHDHQQHQHGNSNSISSIQPVLMSRVFEVDSRTGVLWNLISLRPYIDGYFEIQVKAESGPKEHILPKEQAKRCQELGNNSTNNSDIDCSQLLQLGASGERAAIIKAVLFVTQQKETFRLVFNKTKLDDRLDEFKLKVQDALENVLFGQSSTKVRSVGSQSVPVTLASTVANSGAQQDSPTLASKAEKLFFNTFSLDFYEREDGSLDFSTLTSCTQLIKFDSRSTVHQLPLSKTNASPAAGNQTNNHNQQQQQQLVPNQVIGFDEVVELLETLNATQVRSGAQKSSPGSSSSASSSLFSQYGLVKIERCLPERSYAKMSASERVSIWFAGAIAVVSFLLSFVAYKWVKYYHSQLDKLNKQRIYQHQQASRQGSMLYGMPPALHPISNYGNLTKY